MALWVNPLAEGLDTEELPAFDGWAVLLGAIGDSLPSWMTEAACAHADPSLFFPERGESTEPAKALCASCSTVEPCSAWARATEARHGIWAGVSVARRDKGLTPVKE